MGQFFELYQANVDPQRVRLYAERSMPYPIDDLRNALSSVMHNWAERGVPPIGLILSACNRAQSERIEKQHQIDRSKPPRHTPAEELAIRQLHTLRRHGFFPNRDYRVTYANTQRTCHEIGQAYARLLPGVEPGEIPDEKELGGML